MKPRAFLFYGTDSRTSLKALKQWEEAFLTKHGNTSRYIINADGLSDTEIKIKLADYLQGQTLFPIPKLIVIKRVTARDKGATSTTSKVVGEVLEGHLSLLDDQVTVAIWEEKGLREKHPLLLLFSRLEKEGLAKVKLFTVPDERRVSAKVEAYVAQQEGLITKEASLWIQNMYQLIGKRSRLDKRLKYDQELLEDTRSWWLYGLLDSALLAAPGKELSKELLERLYEPESAVGVFEVVQAISGKRWDVARRLLRELEGGDDSYFSFCAALRWQAQSKMRGEYAEDILRLVVEMELIMKNFSLSPAWLADVMVERLQSNAHQMIMPARKLWLAHLLRS